MARATLATTAWWMCFRLLLFSQISIAVPSFLFHVGVVVFILGGIFNSKDNVTLGQIHWLLTFCIAGVVSACVARMLALQLSTGWKHDTAASDLMREKWKSGLVTGVWLWCILTAALALKGEERSWALEVIGSSAVMPCMLFYASLLIILRTNGLQRDSHVEQVHCELNPIPENVRVRQGAISLPV